MKFQHNYHYVPKELITNEAIHAAVVYALECAGGYIAGGFGEYPWQKSNSRSLGLCTDEKRKIMWSSVCTEEPITLQQLFNHEDFKWPEGMGKIGYVDNKVVFYNDQEYSYIGDPSRYRLGYNFNLRLQRLTLIATKENKGENTMSNQFTKDMLVAGKHVVEYRDGNRRLVVETGEGLGFISATEFMESCRYEQNLSNVEFDDLDIVKVYEMFNLFSLRSIFEDSNLNLIWQREEKSQQEVEYEKLMQQISELQKQAEKLKP